LHDPVYMRWVGGLSRALVSRRPGAVLDLLCSVPRVVFNYSTSEGCLLGALVAAATAGHWPATAPRRSGARRHGGRRVLGTSQRPSPFSLQATPEHIRHGIAER